MSAVRRKNKNRKRPSQLISFVPNSYWDRTSRPIYALAYLFFFILLYEIGTFYIQPEALSQSLSRSQLRVVSFVWVQNLMEYIFSEKMSWIATPFVVVVILFALQLTSRTKWHVKFSDFIPMTIECVLLSIPLIVLSLAMNRPSTPPLQETVSTLSNWLSGCAAGGSPPGNLWVDIVTGIGAGIYEELIFRLILISVLMMLFQEVLNLDNDAAVLFSVLISAVLFSVHHHFFVVDGHWGSGEPFVWVKFIFRMIAGIYFAVIFSVRGFAIAAGSHAYYDIIAACLNAVLFAA